MKIKLQYQDKTIIPKGFYKSLSILIQLPNKPKWIRNFKYEWQSIDKTAIVGPISPKILKFDDGTCLMANRYIGTWVYNPECPLVVEWLIFGENVQPYFRYDSNHAREWLEVGGELSEDLELKLIETKQPFELSFSKIPFKGVVIFTDHCDFDSDILLRRQREFFEKHAIKSTKGFFLRKHSHKGEWNSAFEGNESEFQEWIKDGHELANHSLSQSGLADPKENQKLFENFKNPSVISPVKVWIDHGYQNYNITKTVDLEHRYQSMQHLKSKGINMIWNYFDVTEACDSLNQLDYEQATISRIFRARGLNILDKIRIAFFHLSNENNLLLYRQTAGILKKREFKRIVLLFKNLMRMALGINYKLNLSLLIKRSQTVFNSELDGLQGFQSITVKDWVHALNLPLKRLQSESGLAIIHSYFAFLGNHHVNPLFLNKEGIVSKVVDESFSCLSNAIKRNEIWNPTLTEFNTHLEEMKTLNLESLEGCNFMRYV